MTHVRVVDHFFCAVMACRGLRFVEAVYQWLASLEQLGPRIPGGQVETLMKKWGADGIHTAGLRGARKVLSPASRDVKEKVARLLRWACLSLVVQGC